MKLAVGYPWDSPFMFTCFTEAALNMKGPPGVEMRWFRGEGYCSVRRHIDLLDKARAWGADRICFVGSDQWHPEDLLPRLWQRMDEGYEVIAALVPMRGHVEGQGSRPFQPMAWRFNTSQTGFDPINVDDGPVQPIDIIGSGALMFPAYLLDKIKKPWFFDHLDVETRARKNLDDSLFVRRLKTEGGAQVYAYRPAAQRAPAAADTSEKREGIDSADD